MKAGPDIAMVASLLGDPARANMLSALMDQRALTASELAQVAGVTAPTASAHLGKLQAGGLVDMARQGRHRYYRLTGADVAEVLESLMGLAARTGHLRQRTGPRDPELRRARICYDHLAGELGVRMFDSLRQRGLVTGDEATLSLSPAGAAFIADLGIALTQGRRPMCKACLDWSARRAHLSGGLGAALLDRLQDLGWARREPESRIVRFSVRGESAFLATFPLQS